MGGRGSDPMSALDRRYYNSQLGNPTKVGLAMRDYLKSLGY